MASPVKSTRPPPGIRKTYGKDDDLPIRRRKGASAKPGVRTDTASDLFDAAFGGANRPINKPPTCFGVRAKNISPTRASPRKEASSAAGGKTFDFEVNRPKEETSSKKIKAPDDPYAVIPELPCGSPEDNVSNEASFCWEDTTKGKRKLVESRHTFPTSIGFEPEDSDSDSVSNDEGMNASSQDSLESQGSLTGDLKEFKLGTSPQKDLIPRSSPKRPLRSNTEVAPKLFRGDSGKMEIDRAESAGVVQSGDSSNSGEKALSAGSNSNASKPVYRHTWQSHEEFEEEVKPTQSTGATSSRTQRGAKLSNATGSQPQAPTFRKVQSEPVKFFQASESKILCSKDSKVLFTVVRNVKEAHQCLDHGEAQEYQDDLEYLLDSLKTATTPNLKCLSMIGLAKKCLVAQFRQFIRSKVCVTKIFAAVKDDCDNSSLALCTACVLYLLARDRLSIMIDKPTLELLIQLIDQKEPTERQQSYSKYKAQVWNVLDKWRTQVQSASPENESFMFDVTEENISSSFLTTEALVYISAAVVARRTETWFQQEIRQLGGLESIVKKVVRCVDSLPDSSKELSEGDMEVFKMLKRLLRILENVTFENPQNQTFLISHRGGALLSCCGRIMSFFQEAVIVNEFSQIRAEMGSPSGRTRRKVSPKKKEKAVSEGQVTESAVGKVLASGISDLMRVLCNLSNNNELCCTKLGQLPDFLQNCLKMITCLIPQYIPKQNQFDLLLLVLGLVINMVEHCNANRRALISARVEFYSLEKRKREDSTLLTALTKMFLRHEAVARAVDEEVDKDLDNAGKQASSEQSTSSQERDREPTTQEMREIMEHVMNKAHTHMEDSIAASYIALLIGCVIQQNEDETDEVKDLLSGRSFKPMIESLNKFLEFMELANKSANSKSISKVIGILEKAD